MWVKLTFFCSLILRLSSCLTLDCHSGHVTCVPCACSALGKHLFGTLHCLCYLVQNSSSCVMCCHKQRVWRFNTSYSWMLNLFLVGCNVSVVYTPGVSWVESFNRSCKLVRRLQRTRWGWTMTLATHLLSVVLLLLQFTEAARTRHAPIAEHDLFLTLPTSCALYVTLLLWELIHQAYSAPPRRCGNSAIVL